MPKMKYSQFKIVEFLGNGGFARVYKALYLVDHKYYALKIILKNNSNLFLHYKRETYIHRKCQNHPYIVQLYDFIETTNYLILVLELCDQDFHSLIETEKKLSYHETAKWMNQVIQALKHCHSMNVLHRDIKPENLFFNADKTVLKLGDFGMAMQLSKGKRLSKLCGTLEYVSPEMLENSYNHAVDIWSLGVLCYECLHGFLKSRKEKFTFEPDFDTDAIDFIQSLCDPNEKKRLSFDEIEIHPFLLKYIVS